MDAKLPTLNRRDCLKTLSLGAFAGAAAGTLPACRRDGPGVPEWVTFPEEEWVKIEPADAGLDAGRMDRIFASADIHPGGFGGTAPGDDEWGAVLTRGGYLVYAFGDPTYKTQSASLGKCLVRALLGLAVDDGLVDPDEPIWKTWTGRDELSHPHKYLDEGHHKTLTWRKLVNHRGGFILESGYHWRNKPGERDPEVAAHWIHGTIPDWTKWTGDPIYDNYSHTEPGTITRYSSGGYVRLGQALTVLWDRDLKDVIDERLFGPMGIPPGRWEWKSGKVLQDTKDFYPAIPHYGEYVDPPYEINGNVVRGGPGWFMISSEDLARFGLLIATRGIWRGERLVSPEWLRGHAGLDIHVTAGDPDTCVSVGKTNTKNFPFGGQVGARGYFSFPKDLITGPVSPPQASSYSAY